MAEGVDAGRRTGGAVDPTVAQALSALGYDIDIDLVRGTDRPLARVRRAPGWRSVRLADGALTMPAGVRLDLGATAKASAADRCAREAAAQCGAGVLVSLGGDIATAGPAPDGGWDVAVQDLPEDPPAGLLLPAGRALATSSTRKRAGPRAVAGGTTSSTRSTAVRPARPGRA